MWKQMEKMNWQRECFFLGNWMVIIIIFKEGKKRVRITHWLSDIYFRTYWKKPSTYTKMETDKEKNIYQKLL